MLVQVFDLLYTDPDQVREFLLAIARSGLVGGVYLWFNRFNGKMYVGSSLNLCTRIRGYLNLSNLHGIIGNAILKYGLVSFILVIVLVPDATAPLVLSLEQSVLDNGICAYNILPTAGSSAGYKHSDEAKEKMKGREHSDESKSKISSSLKGNNNKYNKGKTIYLYLVHVNGFELSAIFPNGKRCCETLGIPYTTLINRIKNRTLFEINGLQHIVSRNGNLASF